MGNDYKQKVILCTMRKHQLRIIYGVAEHWVNRIRNKGNKKVFVLGVKIPLAVKS